MYKMQRLEVNGAVRPLYGSLGVKRLRHCATSRKVADSIPDGGTGFFKRFDRSGRTMALGSTQPVTEMSK